MGAVVGGAAYGAIGTAVFAGAAGKLLERYGLDQGGRYTASVCGPTGFIVGGVMGAMHVKERQKPKPIDHEYDPTEL